jgi:hypothetical protein
MQWHFVSHHVSYVGKCYRYSNLRFEVEVSVLGVIDNGLFLEEKSMILFAPRAALLQSRAVIQRHISYLFSLLLASTKV